MASKILMAVIVLLLLGTVAVAAVTRSETPVTAQSPIANVFVGGDTDLYASDGTSWWTAWSSGGNMRAIDIFDGYLYVTVEETVWRSANGYSFEDVYSADDGFRSLEVCGGELWAGNIDGKIYSTSNGTDWGTEYVAGNTVFDMEFDESGDGAIGTDNGGIFVVDDCAIVDTVTVADTDITSIGLDTDEDGNAVIYAGGAGTNGSVWRITEGLAGTAVFTTTNLSGPVELPDTFVLEWSPVLGDRISYPYGSGRLIEAWRSDQDEIIPDSGIVDITDTGYDTIYEMVFDDYSGKWYAAVGTPADGGVFFGDLDGFAQVLDLPAEAYSVFIGSIDGSPIATPTPLTELVDTPTPTPTATRTPTPASQMLFSSLDSTPTRMPILQLGFASGAAATPLAIPPTNTPTPTATPTPEICIEPTPIPTVVGTIAPSQPSSGSSIPVSDTFICSLSDQTNYGNSPTLSLNNGCSILTKFSAAAALPADATVRGATLRLFILAQPNLELGDTVFFVNSVLPGTGNATWTEMGATWRDRNPNAAWSLPGARRAGSDYASTPIGYMTVDGNRTGWVDIAIDPLVVQDWIDAPEDNFGFIVWSNTTSHNLRLTSSEWADPGFRPYLKVDMVVPSE